MGNQYLGLSLFIMLLAFFVILNNISEFEDASSNKIINSLSLAFSGNPIGEEDLPSVKHSELIEFREGDVLDDIEGFFKAHLKSFQIRRNRLGTEMAVQISLEEFEEMITGADAEKERAFLLTLVSLLDSAETDLPYALDIRISLSKDVLELPQDDKKRVIFTAAKQVAVWSGIVEKSGMPKRYLSAGIEYDQPDQVTLYFRQYQPFMLAQSADENSGNVE